MGGVYEPVSLGAACETKFQTARKLYKEFYNGKSELGFRMDVKPPDWGQRKYKMRVFDWQDTPFDTLCIFLERDFQNIFDRDQLVFSHGGVVHKELGVNFSHLFEIFDAGWTESIIDKAYPAARAKFDRQVQAFREVLAAPGPFLYIYCAADPQRGHLASLFPMPTPEQVERLIGLLRLRAPGQHFHLMVLGPEHDRTAYAHMSDTLTTGLRPATTDKAKMLAWEGNDAGWEDVLADYRFVIHDMAVASPAPALTPTPEPPPGRARKFFWR